MIIKTFLVCAFFGLIGRAIAQDSPEQRCQAENIPATMSTEFFVEGGDGTVTDSRTSLMWMTCLVGATGPNCSDGEPRSMTWAEALQVAPGLNAGGGFAGHTDWRLANIRELSTLVEMQCEQPAINLALFPGTPAAHVWSSSPYHFYTHYSWYVDYGNGAPTYDERIRAKLVRLVRDAE